MFRAEGPLASPRNLNSYRREAAIWLLASGVGDDQDAAEHFEALLQSIEPRQAELEALRTSCTVEFFVGYSSQTTGRVGSFCQLNSAPE